jgi:phospholipid/cholesterol/gamma-HCH transport system ATP-binding protein
MPDAPILRFDDVNLHFDEAPALVNLSFEMAPGETRVVLGAAGSGKTMLLKTAMGLERPDSGHILLFDQDVTQMQESQLFALRANVGVLFQEGGLFDSMTVGSNVAYPLLNQVKQRALGLDEIEKRVRDALRFVELEHTFDKFPSELSGGMRRRVGIARAIVTEPALVLYDSPTAGLDPITANTIIALIIKQRDSRNTAAIMVTHRYQDGHLMANFRYNPNSGQIERVGSANGPANGAGDAAGGNLLKTEFFVMNEGRLVFAGSQEQLRASEDSYIRKFVK